MTELNIVLVSLQSYAALIHIELIWRFRFLTICVINVKSYKDKDSDSNILPSATSTENKTTRKFNTLSFLFGQICSFYMKIQL